VLLPNLEKLSFTQQRSVIGGWVILCFIGIALWGEINHHVLSYTGLIAALAIVILPSKLSPALLWQCGIMLGVGLIVLIWMQLVGEDIQWHETLNSNIPLLILFAAVSFLRVLPMKPAKAHQQRTGVPAFIQTFLGTHLLAAVINMSASIVVADYLKGSAPMGRTLTTLTMRAVCIAAYWSPFFGAMATVLHYMPSVDILTLWRYGIPLTIVALALTTWESYILDPNKLTQFRGYPIGLEPLLLPLGLLGIVSIASALWPDIATVLLVSIASLALPCLLLVKRQGLKQSTQSITKHISFGLGNLRGEFLLFISAGVLGSAGTILLQHYPPSLPFEVFDASVASVLLLILLAIALLGAHTLVGISISAPIILSTGPDITLLALCYLSAWSIAATMSPFSGLSLMFRGHYQLGLVQLFQYHWRYGVLMTAASIAIFYLI